MEENNVKQGSPTTSDSTIKQNDQIKEENKSTGGGWWGGFFDKVKQSSESIIKIYKEDLTEFGKTLQHDTTEAIKKTAEEEKVAEITSTIQSGISNLLGLNTQKGEEESNQNQSSKQRVVVNRHQSRVQSLQTDPTTYTTDPVDLEDYNLWKETSKVSTLTDEISQLLAANDKIREIHTKLVPITVSYTDFWNRYYYKTYKLNQEEERRAALIKRATNDAQEADEEDFGWGEDEVINESTSEETKEENKEEVEKYFDNLDKTSSPTVEKMNNLSIVDEPVTPTKDIQQETKQQEQKEEPVQQLVQPVSQPVIQPVQQPVQQTQPVEQLVQPVQQPVTQSVTQPVSQPVSQVSDPFELFDKPQTPQTPQKQSTHQQSLSMDFFDISPQAQSNVEPLLPIQTSTPTPQSPQPTQQIQTPISTPVSNPTISTPVSTTKAVASPKTVKAKIQSVEEKEDEEEGWDSWE